jgi:hypothetical protein
MRLGYSTFSADFISKARQIPAKRGGTIGSFAGWSHTSFTPSIGPTKTAILLDVETTGLAQRKDEVVELGMIKFDYLPDGRIASIRDVFSSFNELLEPIPPDVIVLTGITNEMVAGHRIDEAAVSSFADEAVIVIAHNSGFARKFAERYWPIFQRKAWGCSATEIEWRKHGFEGSRLGYRRRLLPPGSQGRRRLPRPARNSLVRAADDRIVGRSPSCWSELARRRCGSGQSNRPSSSKTCSSGAVIVGATVSMAGQGHGTSTSTKADWTTK